MTPTDRPAAGTRPAAPSRIGKSLGAILSNPRRGEPEDEDQALDPASGELPQVAETARPAIPQLPDPASSAAPTRSSTRANAPVAAVVADEPLRPVVEPVSGSEPTLGGQPNPSGPAPSPSAAVVMERDEDTADSVAYAGRKRRETFLIPTDLAEQMRNAIVHLSGPPLYYTLAEFGEHAIRDLIGRLEREHNGGRPFPPRPRQLRQGRPLR